jgi:formylglycine-generating enzyme required for sulfatase activity
MTWTPSQNFAEAFIATIKNEPTALMFHGKLRRDLLERFPFAQWEIWSLCAALEEGIFLDLSMENTTLSEETARELATVLVQRLSVSEELAVWTVRTLSLAFDRTPPAETWTCGRIHPTPVPHLPETAAHHAGRASNDAYPLVAVPAGSYSMGSVAPAFDPSSLAGKRGIIPASVPHQVELTRAYAMGIFPVTNGYWRHIAGRRHTETGYGGDDHPVTGLTFFDVVAFCNKASAHAGLPEAYRIEGDKVTWLDPASEGYRLPTEAEWEIACRAGTESMYGTAEQITSQTANYDGQFEGGAFRATTTPTGLFPANPWGIYDMHGNVHEWCWDLSDGSPQGEAFDPKGPVQGAYRIVRGGAWTVWRAEHCASSSRIAFRPDMPGFDCGFRMVRTRSH